MGLLSDIFDVATLGIFDDPLSPGGTTAPPAQVWNQQVPFLGQLYGQAQSLARQQQGMGLYGGQSIGGASQGLVNQLWGGLGGFGAPATNPAWQNLAQRMTSENPYLQGQVSGLGTDIGQFLNEQILPGIANRYGAAGGSMGGRQSVAEQAARRDALTAFQRGAGDLRFQGYGAGGLAAAQLGALGNQYLSQGLGNLYGLGMSPWAAAWQPLQNAAGIFGPPTILGQGYQSSGPGWLGQFLGGSSLGDIF